MRIIYLTTSLCEDDYNEFTKLWKITLNPSNQNFHNKMIRALSIYYPVDVISLRPFSRTKCRVVKLQKEKTVKDNVTYHYLAVGGPSLLRAHSFKKQAARILNSIELEDTVILSDTINPKAISVANYLKKKFSLPLVGVCTDSPSNISNTRRSYTLYLMKKSKDLDGYIGLTKELVDLFNSENRPSMVIEGLVENKLPEPIENKYGDYLFFGGALMRRYGIYDLISAFKKIDNSDLKLLICGHHADEEGLKKAMNGDKRIVYLKRLPVKKVLQLEMNAIGSINPRPFSEDLDRYSIPSKTIEYLSSGRPVISVKNSKLQKKFMEEIIWSKSSNEDELATAINRLLSLNKKEQQDLGKRAQEKVLSLYSLPVAGKEITDFISQFVN